MKVLIVLIFGLLLTGCNYESDRKDAELRLSLFNKCMEFAVRIERKGDDDVSDIISECDSVSVYQARHLRVGL